MKYEIDIDGLPDNWKPVAYRVPKIGDFIFDEYSFSVKEVEVDSVYPALIVEKIHPRRIVLEETDDVADVNTPQNIVDENGIHKMIVYSHKIWREVKEGE